MAKRNSKYWATRLLKQQEHLWDNIVGQTEAEIAQQYLRLEKKVENELNRLLLEIIKDKGTTEFNVADLYKYQRYYDLENFIREQLNKMGVKEYEVMTKAFTDMYKENYKIVSKYVGNINNKIDEEKIKLVIDEYWVGNKNFSQRLWANQAALNQALKDELVNVVALGESHDKVAMSIMRQFGVGYNQAIRLARTEITRVQNESTFQRYKDSGIEKYQFMCAEDERTCKVCRELDGKQFFVSEKEVGKNVGPIHCNCRCTTIAVLDGFTLQEAPNYHPERQ